MEFVAVSLNHRVTPLALRESVAFDAEEGRRFLSDLRDRHGLHETLLVSTCNRTEIYAVPPAGAGRPAEAAVLDALSDARGFRADEAPRNHEVFRDDEAVRHLFIVASGLDSQILGESQILAQVKQSLAWSQVAGTAGRAVHRLWEQAIRVGKRVRAETAIGQGAVSASYAALELARKIFGRLDDKKVLLIGTGKIGLLVLKDLEGLRTGGLTIMNRTRSVAEQLAGRFGGQARSLDELADALADADLVISSTGSREPLVRYEQMRRVRQRRRGERPLLIVDLALPRDFEEACGTLDEVFLKNLDDLTEIVEASAAERRSEIPRAEAMIDREVASFQRWLQAVDLEPTILKLRELLHSIRVAELGQVSGNVDPESLRRIERYGERLVNRIFHVFSQNLRRHDGLRDQELMAVVHRILTEEIPYERPEADGAEGR